MRIVYYTRPSFLDEALEFTRAMSERTELHLLVEVSPEAWRSSLFDVAPRQLPPGVIPGHEALADCFPVGVQAYWQAAASFHLVVHASPRSVHPAAWYVSQRAARFIRQLRPDVVHFDDLSLRVASVVPGLGRIPVVVNVHDPQPHIGERDWRTSLSRELLCRRAGHIVLHNATQLEGFRIRHHLSADRVTVVHLGPYTVYRQWIDVPRDAEPATVLFFGRIAPYKGLDTLYTAATEASEKIPNLRLVVAGRPIAGYVAPAPPRLANGGRVDVLDSYVSNATAARLFQAATAVVCPYVEATQSGVVLTALAFDRPVIASDIGGLREYVRNGETGVLIPPDEPRALARALTAVLGDSDLRAHLARGAQEARHQRGAWSAAADRVLAVYRSVARRT